MEEVIHPIQNTYLQLLPVELRNSLYFFKNTIRFLFKIAKIKDGLVVSIRIYDIKWFIMTLVIEREHILWYDMANFIKFAKNVMALRPTGLFPTAGLLISANSVTNLTIKYHSDALTVDYYPNNQKNNVISSIDLPLCTDLLKLLENIDVLLK